MKLEVAELRENKEAIKYMYNVQLLNANAIAQQLQKQGTEVSYATVISYLREIKDELITQPTVIAPRTLYVLYSEGYFKTYLSQLHYSNNGSYPTLSQIAADLGLSVSITSNIIKEMNATYLIRKKKHPYRTEQIVTNLLDELGVKGLM